MHACTECMSITGGLLGKFDHDLNVMVQSRTMENYAATITTPVG